MLPVSLRALGLLLFLAGFVSALMLRALPPASPLFWFIPCGLLFSGGIISFGYRNRRGLLGVFAATGLAVLLLRLPLWPTAINGATDSGARQGQALHTARLQVPEKFRHGGMVDPRELQLFEGLQISVFAAGLDQPRMLAFSPAGDLYVSLPGAGQVVVLPDADHDGVADRIALFAADLDRPHGLAFSGRDLLVAENGRLLKMSDQDADLKADKIEIISRDLPAGGGHWTRSVLIGTDGAYYVSAGSSCNVCTETDPRRAAILRIDSTGDVAKIYASGLRNSVGLARHPQTGEIWASDNGRDMLGDDLPPEELNRIVAGGDYGWPRCYGQQIPDPDLGNPELCRASLPPVVEMQAHSAPLGVAFGTGLNFPPQLQQMLFVAFHGSWNRSLPTGYKLIGIPFSNGQPSGPPQDILRGWLQDHSAWGRPVAPVVGPDGALYLSDDRAGVIYRITSGTGH